MIVVIKRIRIGALANPSKLSAPPSAIIAAKPQPAVRNGSGRSLGNNTRASSLPRHISASSTTRPHVRLRIASIDLLSGNERKNQVPDAFEKGMDLMEGMDDE